MTEIAGGSIPDIVLEDHEKAKPVRYPWMSWWLLLLVTGESRPIPDKKVLKRKKWWFGLQGKDAEAKRAKALARMEKRLAEHQTSSVDLLVKLTLVAGFFGAISTLLLTRPGPLNIWTWIALGWLTLAMLATLALILPKIKEWFSPNREEAENYDIHIERLIEDNGWSEFLRIWRRLAHRYYLVTLERREQGVGIVAIFLAWCSALQALNTF